MGHLLPQARGPSTGRHVAVPVAHHQGPGRMLVGLRHWAARPCLLGRPGRRCPRGRLRVPGVSPAHDSTPDFLPDVGASGYPCSCAVACSEGVRLAFRGGSAVLPLYHGSPFVSGGGFVWPTVRVIQWVVFKTCCVSRARVSGAVGRAADPMRPGAFEDGVGSGRERGTRVGPVVVRPNVRGGGRMSASGPSRRPAALPTGRSSRPATPSSRCAGECGCHSAFSGYGAGALDLHAALSLLLGGLALPIGASGPYAYSTLPEGGRALPSSSRGCRPSLVGRWGHSPGWAGPGGGWRQRLGSGVGRGLLCLGPAAVLGRSVAHSAVADGLQG
jgi:hypothetical protein